MDFGLRKSEWKMENYPFPHVKCMIKYQIWTDIVNRRDLIKLKKDLQITEFAGPSITYKKILSCLYFFY